MRVLDLSSQQTQTVKNMWELWFSKDYDLPIKYSIEQVTVPGGIDWALLMRNMQGKNVYFSALNGSRIKVRDHIVSNDNFPAGEFCAETPRTAMQFIRGHRAQPRAGDRGYICVLRDNGAARVSSPSVLRSGNNANAARADSYHRTSVSVTLLAVVEVRIRAIGNVSESSVRKRKTDEEEPSFGEKVGSQTKRRMRKIRRKRMDNIGIKDDF